MSKAAATLAELRIMRHMLGATHSDMPGGRPLGWRNYGCWGEGNATILTMIAKGLLIRGRARSGDMFYAIVADEWAKELCPPYRECSDHGREYVTVCYGCLEEGVEA